MFWDDTMVDTTLGNGSQIPISLDGGVPEDEIKGLTAIRMIVRLAVKAVTIGTSGKVSFGVYLIENDALSASVLAEPQDSVDDAGWMWRLAHQDWGAASSVFDASQWFRVHEDLHAMRKYPGEDYTLVLVVGNHDATGSINVDGMVRTLYKRA